MTEHQNAASRGLDSMSAEGILRLMNAEDAAVAAVIPQIAVAVELAVTSLHAGGGSFTWARAPADASACSTRRSVRRPSA